MRMEGNAGPALRSSIIAALCAASACTDNGPPRSTLMDAGETIDAAPLADAAANADAADDVGPAPASDAGPRAPVVMCGDAVCEPHQPSLVERVLAAGCALDHQDAEVCGLATPDAGPIFDGSLPAFLPRDAPGTASPSCGAFLESQLEQPGDAGVDAGDAGYPNARVDVRRTIMPDGFPFEILYVYPGCCTVSGACGVDSRNGLAIQKYGGLSYNAGYGCVDPGVLFAASAPALGTMRCDPQTGLIMPQPDAGADAGTDAGTDAGMDAGRDAGPSDAGADAGNG